MKKLLLVLVFSFVAGATLCQELNTYRAIDSFVKKTSWKTVKKVKRGNGKKDFYARDKHSDKNYWFLIHRAEGGATECIYHNDELTVLRQYSKSLPSEKEANVSTFLLSGGKVIDKFVRGREVSPETLLEFAEQSKEEAKRVIFQKP